MQSTIDRYRVAPVARVVALRIRLLHALNAHL